MGVITMQLFGDQINEMGASDLGQKDPHDLMRKVLGCGHDDLKRRFVQVQCSCKYVITLYDGQNTCTKCAADLRDLAMPARDAMAQHGVDLWP